MTSSDNHAKTIFWHRDLPPLDAEVVAEHTVEASSGRVPGRLLTATSCGNDATGS
jgi:hypothetical protein